MKSKKSKFILILVSVISIIFLINGCSSAVDKKDVLLNRVDISRLNNKNISDKLNASDLEDGVYLIETNSKRYVFFNGKNYDYINEHCEFEEPYLKIHVNTKDNIEGKQKSLFEIVPSKDINFDTIRIFKDKKESSFSAVIAG